MSETMLSVLIAVGILLALAVWVPFLIVCHGCTRRWSARRESVGSDKARAYEAGLKKFKA